MNSEEIKAEKEKMFDLIKYAKERLQEIRQICKHENKFEGNYEWAAGHMYRAEICDDCGEMIKIIEDFDVINL